MMVWFLCLLYKWFCLEFIDVLLKVLEMRYRCCLDCSCRRFKSGV